MSAAVSPGATVTGATLVGDLETGNMMSGSVGVTSVATGRGLEVASRVRGTKDDVADNEMVS